MLNLFFVILVLLGFWYLSWNKRQYNGCLCAYWPFKKSMAFHRFFVFLRKGLRIENIAAGEEFRLDATLAHECDGHVMQQRRDGWFRFHWRYIFDTRCPPFTVPGAKVCEQDIFIQDARWRGVYESEGYGISAHVWKENNRAMIGLNGVFDRAIKKVVERKYPRWWFGTPPSYDVARAMVYGFYRWHQK